MRRRWDDVQAGVAVGLWMGGFFALIALVAYFVSGSKSLVRTGIALWQMLMLYAGGGILAGAGVGLLKPLVTSRPRAIIVGCLVAFPVLLCAYPLKYGPFWSWDREPWLATVIGSLMFGTMGAMVFYTPTKKS